MTDLVCGKKRGRRPDIGLGNGSKVTLAVARDRAREVWTWVELGLDPVFEKRKADGIPTFREATAKVYAANRKSWRDEKHEGNGCETLGGRTAHGEGLPVGL